jgi:protein ImuB
VRIPRFAIGAIWRTVPDAPSAPQAAAAQLPLPLTAEGPRASSSSSAGLPLAGEHWDDLPIVLTDGQKVRTATAAAGRTKIRSGMVVGEAKSRCASLRVLAWDDDVIARDVTRATAAFVRASPQVTPAIGAPGLWWVGASGLGEETLARELLAIAQLWHPRARVAIADSCVAARAGTWEHTGRRAGVSRGWVRVPPGGCAAYLARAPLGLLTIDDDLRETLRALGLRTIGEFARLGAEDVERRWGEVGLAAWRLARGEDQRRPGLTRVDTPRAVTTELHPSVSTTEPVLFLVRAALDRLVTGLLADGRAAATLALTLGLDDVRNALPVPTRQHTITREIRLPRPLARAVPLLERCRALLDDWPLTAPVCSVTLAITATAPLSGAQGELLDPAWRDPAAADAAFARLRATLGTDAVVRPVTRDTHHPDRSATWVRVDDSFGDAAFIAPRKAAPATHVLHPALRRLDPPEQVEVAVEDEMPRAVRWRGRWLPVARAIGPERLAGDWWDEGYARDYWRCEDDHGGLALMVYHDRHASAPDAWYLQGWFD